MRNVNVEKLSKVLDANKKLQRSETNAFEKQKKTKNESCFFLILQKTDCVIKAYLVQPMYFMHSHLYICVSVEPPSYHLLIGHKLKHPTLKDVFPLFLSNFIFWVGRTYVN